MFLPTVLPCMRPAKAPGIRALIAYLELPPGLAHTEAGRSMQEVRHRDGIV